MNATYLEHAYVFNYPDHEIEITLDRLYEDPKDGLKGSLTVTTTLEPKPGLLHQGKFSVEAPLTRTQVANKLTSRTGPGWHDDTDFTGILEEVCYLALKRWREGEPLIDLRTAERKQRSRWLLEPYVEYGGPTVIFAKGGSGKSLFGLATCISLASGAPVVGIPVIEPVACLYLDWETDEATHMERLDALVKGHEVVLEKAIYYRRMIGSLSESAESLRREIALKEIGYIVGDSLGSARGGDPVKAEPTIKTFVAARSLGKPIMFLDHMSKGGIEGDSDMPYGSVYTENMARRTYKMAGVDVEGKPEKVVSITNEKVNNGRPVPKHAYRLSFTNDNEDNLVEATIYRVDMLNVPELSDKLSQVQRIELALREAGRTLTVRQISEATAETGNGKRVSEPMVKNHLNHLRNKRFYQDNDKWPPEWGLYTASYAD